MQFVLRAFLDGVDGVVIVGCKLGECNYATQGNYYALSMSVLCRRLMEHMGINPERLTIEFMSSADGIRFAAAIIAFSKKVRELGPLGEGEGLGRDAVKAKLREMLRLVPYIKIANCEKLSSRLEGRQR
jgi:coenzyme F420-reducing hydrogenase delta subunit